MRVRKSAKEADPWRLIERRKEARYTLILRVGVLEQGGKTSLCLVKNISSAGVQLKFYSRPRLDEEASLRVGDELPVHGRIVWLEGDIAGMNFHEELDTPALLRVQQKLRANRRRTSPRVNVEASAILRTGGRTLRAEICDISSLGARLRTSNPLMPGNRAIIELADLPSLNAFIRWIDGDEAGLAFETPIPMQIIAHWLEGRVRGTISV
jgi:hypothetical protein